MLRKKAKTSRKMFRSRLIRVSVSSQAEIQTSRSRGNVGRSQSRSRLSLGPEGLVYNLAGPYQSAVVV